MSFLPGWDSVDSTATLAHNLHVTAVIVLGLLFLAEGMALIYDSRNHRLVAVAEGVRASEQKAKDDKNTAEIGGLKGQLTEAEKKVAGLQTQTIARRLTGDQTAELVKILLPFKGQKVFIWCSTAAWDATPFAADFLEVFKQAGWEPTDQIRYGIVVGGDAVGIEVLVNPQMANAAGQVSMPSVVTLINALAALKLIPEPALGRMPEIEVGTIYFRIGRIPPK